MAQLMISRLKPMPDCDALVENETFSLPQAFFLGHGFEVFEDAALEVIDLLVAQAAQESGG